MAGGPHAATVPCKRCGAPAARVTEGIETDGYACGACGHGFAIDWASGGAPDSPIEPGSWLTLDETESAAKLTVWVVWYADRFGWGPDREPTSPVATWGSEAEAASHVRSLGGDADIETGRFDGHFARETSLLRAVETGAATAARARELLRAAADAG